MLFSESDIISKSWLVREVVNLVIQEDKLEVDKIFLIGSYASGKQDEWSDIDFLVQLKGGKLYPTDMWKKIGDIHFKLGTGRVHVIFGTEDAQKQLSQRSNKPYREIKFQGGLNDSTHRTSN